MGLGNPGSRYEGTRHNVGAEAVELLALRHGAKLRGSRRQLADTDEVVLGGRRLLLAVPRTYMNESGQAVGKLRDRAGITRSDQIVVVHDELDLDPGRVKVKQGGGLAGHNGLRSVHARLGTADFLRVRIGVGRPPGGRSGVDHVLGRPGRRDRHEIERGLEEAADAVEAILTDGVEAAMNRFNASDRR